MSEYQILNFILRVGPVTSILKRFQVDTTSKSMWKPIPKLTLFSVFFTSPGVAMGGADMALWTNLVTLPQSRECRDVKKLYRNNGHNVIHHGTSTNQLEKLFHTLFWMILVTINVVPPIQATYRVFEPLTPDYCWNKYILVIRISKHLPRACSQWIFSV